MLRLVVCGLLLLALAPVTTAEDKPPRPIPPAEAKNHVGQKVTVEMTVKAAKKSTKQMRVFLDSLENFQDPDNLGVAISEVAEMDLLRKHATADIVEFFRGKPIRVTGKIERRDDRTYLDIEDANQLELIAKSPS